MILASVYAGLKFAFKITFTKPDFLWNVNVQIATVCVRLRNNILLELRLEKAEGFGIYPEFFKNFPAVCFSSDQRKSNKKSFLNSYCIFSITQSLMFIYFEKATKIWQNTQTVFDTNLFTYYVLKQFQIKMKIY